MIEKQLLQQERLVSNMKTQLYEAMNLLTEMKADKQPSPKWEPRGGSWFVSGFEVINFVSQSADRRFGMERVSKDEALIASNRMKQSNLLHAWVAENIAGDVKYKIEFEANNVAIVIYAPEDDICRLEQLVNDGVVVL